MTGLKESDFLLDVVDEFVLLEEKEEVVVDTVEEAGEGNCWIFVSTKGGRRRWCWLCLDEILEAGEAGKLVLFIINGDDVVEGDERTMQIMMW